MSEHQDLFEELIDEKMNVRLLYRALEKDLKKNIPEEMLITVYKKILRPVGKLKKLIKEISEKNSGDFEELEEITQKYQSKDAYALWIKVLKDEVLLKAWLRNASSGDPDKVRDSYVNILSLVIIIAGTKINEDNWNKTLAAKLAVKLFSEITGKIKDGDDDLSNLEKKIIKALENKPAPESR